MNGQKFSKSLKSNFFMHAINFKFLIIINIEKHIAKYFYNKLIIGAQERYKINTKGWDTLPMIITCG